MSDHEGKRGGFHYAFLIVAACICMCAACSLTVNCVGIYLPAVSAFFGVTKTQFMLYFTILCVTMTIMLPIAGKIMEHVSTRVFFTICAILCACGNVILSTAQAMWVFYIGGVILGAGTAPMLFLAVPKLIGAWCAKRVGFFTGLALAFTGIGGVVFNPVQAAFISAGPEGWRTAYLVAAVIMLVLTLPFTLFVIRDTPEEKGLKPYGYSEEAEGDGDSAAAAMQKGTSANKAMKTGAFYAIAIMGGLFAVNQMVYQYMPAYVQTFPDVAALGAVVASACMAGLSIGKIFLGFVNDHSAKLGVMLSVGLGIIGILMVWLMPGLAPMLLIGAFLFGFVYAGTTLETTLLTRTVFGNKDFATIYSRASIFSSLGGAFGASLWGLIADSAGFSAVFAVSIVMMVVCFLLAMYALSQREKYANATE